MIKLKKKKKIGESYGEREKRKISKRLEDVTRHVNAWEEIIHERCQAAGATRRNEIHETGRTNDALLVRDSVVVASPRYGSVLMLALWVSLAPAAAVT